MILHAVIFAWNDSVDYPGISRLENDLRSLAAEAGALSFETGRDGKFRNGAADFVVVGKFADEASLQRYLEHPAHEQLLDDYARAMVARRESVQAVLS